MKSCPSTLQTIKTPWASLVILYTYVKNTNINIWTLFFSVMFVVLSVRPEWQNRFMQTGEDSFMHTLDWWQLDWQGMNAKKSWGHHTQQHWGASTSKRKARFFFYTEGRITGQASTLTVHHSAFVDYRLVFPRRTRAQADRTHIRVSLRVSWKKQQKSKQRLCQMFAGPVTQGQCTAERNIKTLM